MATAVDLLIHGGTVVTAGGRADTDIGVREGRIAQIGGDMTPARAERSIDASGLLVLPGAVDVHTHLTTPPPARTGPAWVDDFKTGTAAALAGGITTVGNMSTPGPGQTPAQAVARDAALAAEQALGDVILHPVFREITPDTLAEIPALAAQGCTTIKFFMVMPGYDAQAAGFAEATARAGAAGMMTMIHCEDHAIIARATERLLAAGRGDLRHYAESRPVISEVVATERAVALAEATGAPVYVVHLSSAAALDVCHRAQARGLPVYVETRPLYLHLTAERLLQPDGAKYIGQPPLREGEDVAAIWHGLAGGTVHTIGSDHAPWALAAKLDPDLSVARVRPGVENLETQLAMLYSEGVRGGRISLERLVAVTSTNPAKLFGLYPQKGCIAPGSDADLVLLDPELTRTVGGPRHSRCDYSVYEGWQVTGWPVLTVRRGEVVYERGRILAAPGSGRLLRRGPTRPL